MDEALKAFDGVSSAVSPTPPRCILRRMATDAQRLFPCAIPSHTKAYMLSDGAARPFRSRPSVLESLESIESACTRPTAEVATGRAEVSSSYTPPSLPTLGPTLSRLFTLFPVVARRPPVRHARCSSPPGASRSPGPRYGPTDQENFLSRPRPRRVRPVAPIDSSGVSQPDRLPSARDAHHHRSSRRRGRGLVGRRLHPRGRLAPMEGRLPRGLVRLGCRSSRRSVASRSGHQARRLSRPWTYPTPRLRVLTISLRG